MTRAEALAALGLSDLFDLDHATLVAAYRAAAQRTHPDVMGGSADAFLHVKRAYDFLRRGTVVAALASARRCDDCQGTGYVKHVHQWTAVVVPCPHGCPTLETRVAARTWF